MRNITSCSPVKVKRRFGGHITVIFRVDEYCQANCKSRQQTEGSADLPHALAGLLFGLLFHPEYGGDMFFLNVD
jgi:hypothetical protein